MLKVLFVVPRMHPNLREIHSAVTSAGGVCKFLVSEVGPSEPEVFPDRILILELAAHNVSHEQILVDNDIDLVLQRSFRGNLRGIWRVSRALKVTCLVYDQLPISMSAWDFFVRPRRLFSFCLRLLGRRFTLGTHKRLTPIAPWSVRARIQLDNAEHFRFPMAQKERSSGIRRESNQQVICIAKHGHSRKRIRWLLRALEKSGIDFDLVLVGSSPRGKTEERNHSRALKKISRMKRNASRVRVLSDLSEKEVHELLSEATLFVLPSKSEPYAISPLEAMSHQVPALVSSDSGSVGYVRQVSDLLIFRSWSYRDFQNKLDLLLTNHDLRIGLSEKAKRAVEDNHDPSAFVRRLVHLRDGRKILS